MKHRHTTDCRFFTGQMIALGMRPDWSAAGDDFAVNPGAIDAPEIIAAGSWVAPICEDSLFSAYPSGVLRGK